MFSVEKYIEEVQFNLEKKSNELIEAFKSLERVKFPEEAAVLFAWSSFSLDDVTLFLEAHEDMFNSVDPVEEDSDYTSSVILLNSIVLYNEDTKNFNEDEEKKFFEFYSDNDLEEVTIKEYGNWIKKCFDQANITLNEPIYFMILDEDEVLNLVTGEWEDPMEVEL
ncbi:hypothetical protein D6T70_04895 [Kurthia gibsonii]|uniref:hypothetical protein n=1 Tax=Kurthia gibsonii TaxID=33946 RepID=UPI000EAE0191|nr:hypothetical protein [Kurthia gibsonii]RXH52585.1 hypothetical protein D6T70_04895 [Kurthia gibsonii]